MATSSTWPHGQADASDAHLLVEERRGGHDPVAVDNHGTSGPARVGVGDNQPVVDGVVRLTALGQERTDLVKIRGPRLSQDKAVGQ